MYFSNQCPVLLQDNLLTHQPIKKLLWNKTSKYKFSLSVCLFVSNKINVKTAKPIGPKFFVGSRVTPGKVYGWSNFQKFASIKIRFLKILKIHEIFLIKSSKCFVFVLLTRRTLMLFVNKENPHVYKWNKRWARSALKA